LHLQNLNKLKENELTVTTIDTTEGNVRIDSQEFGKFNNRALDVLEQISELQKDLKEIVEEAADATKLKKGLINKYFKSRHKFKTKEAKVEGDLFESLDNALDN
jgi:hypothetical protein